MTAEAALESLAGCLAKLPGVGRRTAERMAMKLVRDEGLVRALADALEVASKTIRSCAKCGALTDVDSNPCRLCTSAGRRSDFICVVEDAAEIPLLERSGGFDGRYHALMGRLSPMKGEGPADLRVRELVARVKDEGIREVVLALSTDMEGDATAYYVAEQLKGTGASVTRLAAGLPTGSSLRYSDAVTLAKAIKGRQAL